MPSLDEPTGAEILATLLVGGAGGQFGQWDEASIDDNTANSLIPIVTREYDYAVALVTAKGLNPAALTQANLDLANQAMIYGIAYQLLQHGEMSQGPINGETGSGIMQSWYNSRNGQYFTMAYEAWLDMGIDATKYYINLTAGFGTETTENFPLRGSDYIESDVTY